ncbi:MAG: hypothetical protein LGR52_08955 [Candidatus Thiosymbion ectosymbiont of Robbea hypermnestra]|nr:hypothetical protein [Candidatus Thiosymbion ectosymbiont of Robbea hypermnestra]
MLRISREQFAQLRRARALDLVPRFIEQLHAQAVVDPAQWTPETLHDDTVTQVETALDLGLGSGRDVLGFLTLRHTVGLGFERLPEVHAALTTPSHPEGWRVDRMMHAFDIGYWIGARDRVQRGVGE